MYEKIKTVSVIFIILSYILNIYSTLWHSVYQLYDVPYVDSLIQNGEIANGYRIFIPVGLVINKSLSLAFTARISKSFR